MRARTSAFTTALCLLLSACGGFYTAEAIDATVVDAETKEPIAGVNVIAEWVIQGGMNYGAVVGYLNVMEAVTDQNGRFHFPGWGPRANFHFGTVFQEAPGLLFFKPGYRLTVEANHGSVLAPSPHRMKSDSNGKIIPMTQRSSITTIHGDYLSIRNEMEDLWGFDEWHHITRFLCALAPARGLTAESDAFWIEYSPKTLRQRGVDCDKTKAKV